MGLLGSIGRAAAGALRTFETVLQAPVRSVRSIGTQGEFSRLREEINTAPISTQVGRILRTTGTAAAAVVAGGAALGSTVARTVGATALRGAARLIPSTTRGRVTAAVVTPIVAGAVIREPERTFQAVTAAPSELAQFGGDIATFAADPSIEAAKEIIAESPLISAAAGLIVGGAAVRAAAPAIGGLITREAIEEQTEVIREVGGRVPITTSEPIAPQTPVTPQTAPLIATAGNGTTTSSSRKRRARKAVMPSIRQNVQVVVSNRNKSIGTKNFIKREVLLN